MITFLNEMPVDSLNRQKRLVNMQSSLKGAQTVDPQADYGFTGFQESVILELVNIVKKLLLGELSSFFVMFHFIWNSSRLNITLVQCFKPLNSSKCLRQSSANNFIYRGSKRKVLAQVSKLQSSNTQVSILKPFSNSLISFSLNLKLVSTFFQRNLDISGVRFWFFLLICYLKTLVLFDFTRFFSKILPFDNNFTFN